MLVALVIFMLTVREKEWAYEMQQQAVAWALRRKLRSRRRPQAAASCPWTR